MAPLKLNATEFAHELRRPEYQISEIISEQRSISVDIALRFAKFFGTDMNLWVNLQAQYETDTISEKTRKELEEIIPYKLLHEAGAE